MNDFVCADSLFGPLDGIHDERGQIGANGTGVDDADIRIRKRGFFCGQGRTNCSTRFPSWMNRNDGRGEFELPSVRLDQFARRRSGNELRDEARAALSPEERMLLLEGVEAASLAADDGLTPGYVTV